MWWRKTSDYFYRCGQMGFLARQEVAILSKLSRASDCKEVPAKQFQCKITIPWGNTRYFEHDQLLKSSDSQKFHWTIPVEAANKRLFEP